MKFKPGLVFGTALQELYQYAKENSCIELNGIVLEYERNFK